MSESKNPQDEMPGAGGDSKIKRTKLVDKIEMMGQDIISSAQESINTIEDLKVKLHADNLQMMQTVEELTDNELSIQNNIKKLEVENDKIKKQLEQQEQLSGGNAG